MPREVFAEDIEQFLGTLDGVASARVFTTPAGEIAQVYVTAERTADPRSLRRRVSTALLSTYSLPVDPWRVLVTQFRGGIRPAEIPRFRVVRVEETVSAAEITATVKIGWIREGREKVATGRARGPTGPASRLRTVAAATVDAVRDALEPAQRHVSVQRAASVTFLDQPVTLVGISVSTPRGPETYVGTGWQEEMPEVAVSAVLDAVTRWLLRAAFAAGTPRPEDRREQLEAMRHFVRAAERGGAARGGVLQFPAADSAEEAPAGEDPEMASEMAGDAPEASSFEPSDAEPGEVPETSVPGPGPDDSPGPEKSSEERGGAAMSVHQEPARGGFVPPRGRTTTMEETFYQSLVEAKTPVHLRCRDGYELPRAVVKDISTYTMLVETPKGTELVFKHAIISIRILPAQVPEA